MLCIIGRFPLHYSYSCHFKILEGNQEQKGIDKSDDSSSGSSESSGEEESDESDISEEPRLDPVAKYRYITSKMHDLLFR